MIIVLGHVDIDPSDVDNFLKDIKEIDPGKKPESGCISYSIAVADPTIGRILVAERWQDQQSLTTHIESNGTLAFVEKWSGRMQSNVLKYDARNERTLLD
ncbi:MAG: antibiotic biosynthesis monooxygenase [Pseudomonadota bacterium]